MTVIVKQKKIRIDLSLILLWLTVFVICLTWQSVVTFVCTHNILKGQW